MTLPPAAHDGSGQPVEPRGRRPFGNAHAKSGKHGKKKTFCRQNCNFLSSCIVPLCSSYFRIKIPKKQHGHFRHGRGRTCERTAPDKIIKMKKIDRSRKIQKVKDMRKRTLSLPGSHTE